jgi:GGDEF domain-containing protein
MDDNPSVDGPVTVDFPDEVEAPLLRAHRYLQRALDEVDRVRQAAIDQNAVTGLPGAVSCEREVARAMRDGREVCVVLADLANLEAYNAAYGIDAGNRMIQLTGDCLCDMVDPERGSGRFVGHLGADDLLYVCSAQEARELSGRIAEEFDKRVRDSFRDRDLERGFFVAVDRQGGPHRFPITTLSMGGVELAKGAYAEAFQVLDACREVKGVAKTHERSCLFVCRRGPPSEREGL